MADCCVRYVDRVDGGGSAEVQLQIGSESHRVCFCSDDVELTCNGEALVATAMAACMKEGGALTVEGDVSERFLDAMVRVGLVMCMWELAAGAVEISGAGAIKRRPSSDGRVGLFFSGGVDSLYSLLKHRDEITDLIFVHGFDTAVDEHPMLREKVVRMLGRVGEDFGKAVVQVETNVRGFLDPYMGWGHAHGAALAAVGHLLYPAFGKIYIAATHTYAQLFPWGSHPLLDPLWSTEALEFVHDGCEVTRVQKVASVAKCDAALQNLLVCMEHVDGAYNCGRCEKCVRTMVNLHAAGALGKCETFDGQLDLERVSRISAFEPNNRSFLDENIEALEGRAEDIQLYRALRKARKRRRRVGMRERLKSVLRRWPGLYDLLKRARDSTL